MHRDAILSALLDRLWGDYINRVPYARTYKEMVEARGGTVVNDHIALRTFNTKTGTTPAGIDAMARIFTALGYDRKEQYLFQSKHLTAWHYEHRTDPEYKPKIFISQLEVDRLSSESAALIKEAVQDAQDSFSASELKLLKILSSEETLPDQEATQLVNALYRAFARPWSPPKRETVLALNKESQYAAWTLLHGHSVNHFTAYINKQNVAGWHNDLEETAHALKAAGVPMKAEFEGERGNKLRQTSTQAVMESCPVIEANGAKGQLDWSYAYYELAERNMVEGPNGPVLFTAFLGDQATNLFEMTRIAQ